MDEDYYVRCLPEMFEGSLSRSDKEDPGRHAEEEFSPGFSGLYEEGSFYGLRVIIPSSHVSGNQRPETK